MTIAAKLEAIHDVRVAIRAAIIAQGSPVPAGTHFDQYPAAIAAIAGSSEWERPSDWLPMPTTAANHIDLLCAVYDSPNPNYIAFNITVVGGYTVDWGDGTVTNHASATAAEHQWDFADTAFDGTETSGGFKQAVVRIYPQAANDITSFNIGLKHTNASASTRGSALDVQINAASATTMTLRTTTYEQLVCERFNFVAIGGITTLASAFLSCCALQSVSFPAGSLTGVTTLAGAFQNCYSLQSVSFPAGSLVSVTTLVNAFASCYSLQSVSFPAGSLTGVTTLANALNACTSLQSVSFPAGSLTGVTTLANAFQTCFSLQSVSFPAGSLTGVTTLANAFQSCFSLQSVSFPAGSLVSVTTLVNAFSGCTSLQSVSFSAGSLGSVSVTTNAFASCTNLVSITNCAIPVSFTVASCKLEAAALDAIYTALPSVTATITVTGNPGTATHTPSIATGKGWTVTV